MKQERNNKGQFLPKQKSQEAQNEKVMLIEEHEHIQTEMGIYTLTDARKLSKQYGGSYIYKPI